MAVLEGGQVYYIRADHIGRPVLATTAAGTVVWTARYLPFGEVRVTTGAPIGLRFPGQWYQAESGLHQNWMRDYDPTTGRYMQADPMGLVDGASVYNYALQNPGRWTDPRGLYADPNWRPGDPQSADRDQCTSDESVEIAGLKDLCSGAWLFICSMMYGIDGDPDTNSRSGTNPHNRTTAPPSERNYTSQPLYPPQSGGRGSGNGEGSRGGGGGGSPVEPFDNERDPIDVN